MGHAERGVLTSLDYKAFLTEHLRRLRCEISALEAEASRVQAILMQEAERPEPQPERLGALLVEVSRVRGADGLPLLRQRRDWYYVLRALADRRLCQQDSYTWLCEQLSVLPVSPEIRPKKDNLCHEAAIFGQFSRSRGEFEARGKDFGRHMAIYDYVLERI